MRIYCAFQINPRKLPNNNYDNDNNNNKNKNNVIHWWCCCTQVEQAGQIKLVLFVGVLISGNGKVCRKKEVRGKRGTFYFLLLGLGKCKVGHGMGWDGMGLDWSWSFDMIRGLK